MKNEHKNSNKKIHMLNARDNVIMSLISSTPNINMHTEINSDFQILLNTLNRKGIDYDKLSKALIPLRDENKYEFAFIFNNKYFNDTMFYGEKIINKILSVINTESTQSILVGDYIKLEKIEEKFLKEIFLEKIEYINQCEYICSDQFYIVYINNLTKKQANKMIENLKNEKYFVGIMNLKYSSKMKQYLSVILSPLCLKCQNKIIIPNSLDIDDMTNYCEQDYSYEKNGFEVISINQILYDLFLAYKIPNGIMNEEDLKFSYNLLTYLAPEYEKIKIVIDDQKLDYLHKNKGGSMDRLGILNITKEELEKKILINMYNNYIYNIEKNEYGDLKFNVLIELQVDKDKVRNALVALKYIPNDNELKLITMF